MATIVLWAREVAGSASVADPVSLLGPPDGLGTTTVAPGWVRLGRFEGGFYRGLLSLLDGHIGGPPLPGYPPRATGVRTRAGDAVTAADLARASVIAFELNGGGPAASGGWESCKWVFEDGVNPPVTVLWDERAWATRPAEVIANGSTDGDRYSELFRISPPTTSSRPSPSAVISYILFSLPTIDVASSGFTITLSGYLTGGEGEKPGTPKYSESSPDPDAIGVVACSHEDMKCS